MAYIEGAELVSISASEACPQALSLISDSNEERHPWVSY